MAEDKKLIAEEGELFQTHVGGSALLEGIMMRGKYNWAVAVRQPDGKIYTESHDLPGADKPKEWKKWPLIRGSIALFESLVLSTKAMEIAAEHAYDFEEDERQARLSKEIKRARKEANKIGCTFNEAKFTQKFNDRYEQELESKSEKDRNKGLGGYEFALSMVGGFILGILGFVVIPAFLSNILVGDYAANTIRWNIVDGVLRAVIFVFYIWLIGRIPDIKRMFGYHGAEHKTIHCFEHGLELTPENAQKFSTMHVRCGTAFIIMTILISIIVFTVVPTQLLLEAWNVSNPAARLSIVILSRILLLPLVAGVAYEITVKWAGARPNNPLVKVILWPGLQMQKLTTNEPDIGQLECAIEAMKLVIAVEAQKEQDKVQPIVFAQMPCQAAGQQAYKKEA
ncbi:MAG: DUF1385 domain-containing protein [Coriobacteriia bacterium]|nr:DUF1385 domain-containing protein [Coriobacteriia bacterium]